MSMSVDFVLGSETDSSGIASKLAAALLCAMMLTRRACEVVSRSEMLLLRSFGAGAADVLLLWFCPVGGRACCRQRSAPLPERERIFGLDTRGLAISGESAPITAPLYCLTAAGVMLYMRHNGKMRLYDVAHSHARQCAHRVFCAHRIGSAQTRVSCSAAGSWEVSPARDLQIILGETLLPGVTETKAQRRMTSVSGFGTKFDAPRGALWLAHRGTTGRDAQRWCKHTQRQGVWAGRRPCRPFAQSCSWSLRKRSWQP